MNADTETIREALKQAGWTPRPFEQEPYALALAALGRVEERQGQLLAQGGRLADQAAWTVAYPRLFHEDDNECQQALSQAVAGFRLAARAALAGSVAGEEREQRSERYEVALTIDPGHAVIAPDGSNAGYVFLGPDSYLMARIEADRLTGLLRSASMAAGSGEERE